MPAPPAAHKDGRALAPRRAIVPRMSKLQWVYVIVGLLVALSMVLAVLPLGR